MGYGDSVPTTGFNAAGMTFEKANGDPTAQRVQEQYVAIWTTLSAAGAKDDALLTEWRAEHMKAYEQGVEGELEPNQLVLGGHRHREPGAGHHGQALLPAHRRPGEG